MNCIAVDDEKLVLELIADNIRQVPYLNLIKTCKTAIEAIEVLEEQPIDLIFLDIQMPKISGLEFIRTLAQPPLIILITAYEQYALEGYNFNIVDYLLKPVSFERFLKACNKARELFELRNAKTNPLSNPENVNHIFVYVEYKLVKIEFDDILFIEGLKDYIKIQLASSNKPVLTRMSMKAFEEKLHSKNFLRTHKSYIVAIDKIKSIDRNLLSIGNFEIPVSDAYKGDLAKSINR